MAIIRGTAGNDTLFGTDLFDTINGDAGDDTIDGGGGNDKMAGGTGNDTFIGGAGADQMDGGTGVDTVTYANSTAGVKVFLATGNGYGGQAEGDTLISIENVTGSQYRDTLIGTDGRNTINGGAGDDTIAAGGDSDVVIGGAGNDWMSGGTGGDTFVFTSASYGPRNGVDTIYGLPNRRGHPGVSDRLLGRTSRKSRGSGVQPGRKRHRHLLWDRRRVDHAAGCRCGSVAGAGCLGVLVHLICRLPSALSPGAHDHARRGAV